MRAFAKLSAILTLVWVAITAPLIPRSIALADCSGLTTCTHFMEVYVQSNLLYNEGHLEVNPGTTYEVDEYMQRDVYPYNDAQGIGTGGPQNCQDQVNHSPLNGYGLTAHYQFKTYFSAQRCDGSDAFKHWHPYNPSGGYWSLGYWSPGQSVYCTASEPPGSMSC